MIKMNKAVKLIKSINDFVSKADDSAELKELLKDHPNADELLAAIDDYETVIGRLLRRQRKEFINALKRYTRGATTDNPIVSAILEMVFSDIQEADDFDVKMKSASVAFLTSTVPKLTSALMAAIDKDIAFNQLSPRTLKWIDDWSEELGNLMKLSTHKEVQKTLREGIEKGLSIQKIELMLAEHPQFNRNRARATAITEVLTANSVSQHEAYMQSPAVVGKTWLHSGPRGIEPRPAHVALHNTTIPLDEYFNVNGYEARYPRDTNLPPSERVYCHCVLAPAVDEQILGLSKEEKEIIRQQAMADMEV